MNGLLNLAFVTLKYITAVSIVLPVSVLVAGLRLAKLSNKSRIPFPCNHGDKSWTESLLDSWLVISSFQERK